MMRKFFFGSLSSSVLTLWIISGSLALSPAAIYGSEVFMNEYYLGTRLGAFAVLSTIGVPMSFLGLLWNWHIKRTW
jgi:hypothetical protein